MNTDERGCPICEAAEYELVIEKHGFHYVRCGSCGAVYVSEIVSPEALHAHYQDPAYFTGDEEQGYRSYADMHKALTPHFQRRLAWLGRQLGHRGRLLDFGCADGYFLELARNAGWEVAGVEVAAAMAEAAAERLGIPIRSSLDDLPDSNFDVITLWEAIEHLPRPVSDLQRLYRRLRPGGALMLSTPNAGHWQAVREPEAWPGYRPPSHLVLFTTPALEGALRRAGFDRIEINQVAPLPPLPAWLRRVTMPLQRALSTGQARPWPVALTLWRTIRLLVWGWHRLARRTDDIFTTLETTAWRQV
jgi:2-polyprenyl-3-methyl-5-hydroxy-6-metoxy-1,4-benzoquinol methylase